MFNDPNIETVYGNGEAIGSLFYSKILKSKTRGFHTTPVGTTIPNNSTAGGRTWGVAKSPDGQVWYSFVDSGILVRDNGNGTSTVMMNGLKDPAAIRFLPNGDLLVPEMKAHFSIVTKASGYTEQKTMTNTLMMPMSAHVAHDGWVYLVSMGMIHRWNPKNDAPENTPELVMGGPETGYEGDGGPFENALINPTYCYLRSDNVLLIADGPNNRLRAANLSAETREVYGTRVAAGAIETFCGKGSTPPKGAPVFDHNKLKGFSGDNGPARDAEIDWPFTLEMDSAGRLYFIDADNTRVRVIDTDGTIYTLVGGLPMPKYNGYRKFAGVIPSFLLAKGKSLGDGAPASAADLNQLMDMMIDFKPDGSFDVYIGDTDNGKVRAVKGFRWDATKDAASRGGRKPT